MEMDKKDWTKPERLQQSIREAVKYYFADFVHNGGVTDLGGTPFPPHGLSKIKATF